MTLAFATIFSLVAAALLAIAFSTDNWITVTVQRQVLKVSQDDNQRSLVVVLEVENIFHCCFVLAQSTENNFQREVHKKCVYEFMKADDCQ